MTKKERERALLKQLMEEYYSKHGVASITHWNNDFSVMDGIVVSGDTDTGISLPIEIKFREGKITQYYSAYLEKKKHDALLQVLKLTDAPAYLYVSDWEDCLTVHTITPATEIKWEQVESQRTNADWFDRTDKGMSFYPYSSKNTVVISKTDGLWKERTVDHLMYYINQANGNV